MDVVAVSMFYGHGICLQFSTREPLAAGSLYPLFDSADGLRAAAGDGECTPVEVNGRGGISITSVRADPGHGNRFRLWAAADEAETASAVQAIRLARRLDLL